MKPSRARALRPQDLCGLYTKLEIVKRVVSLHSYDEFFEHNGEYLRFIDEGVEFGMNWYIEDFSKRGDMHNFEIIDIYALSNEELEAYWEKKDRIEKSKKKVRDMLRARKRHMRKLIKAVLGEHFKISQLSVSYTYGRLVLMMASQISFLKMERTHIIGCLCAAFALKFLEKRTF